MVRKTVALSLDEEIYDNYKEYCEKNAIILSRKVDSFMESELREEKKNAKSNN